LDEGSTTTANVRASMRNKLGALCPTSTLPTYRWLGQQEYTLYLKKMVQQAQRLADGETKEEVWFCEHEPIYTTGKRGVLNNKGSLAAPLIVTDRGGETTFHGTGQLMMYPIIKLKNHHLSVRDYVFLLEESCIQLLATYNITAERDCGLPGVWINNEKIAALGIRVSRGITSHGIALNIEPNLAWFDKINPCGTSRKATSMHLQGTKHLKLEQVAKQWHTIFNKLLSPKTV
jgi:lipoyl(octanoyl) transferase